jgi:hypothetical protein
MRRRIADRTPTRRQAFGGLQGAAGERPARVTFRVMDSLGTARKRRESAGLKRTVFAGRELFALVLGLDCYLA